MTKFGKELLKSLKQAKPLAEGRGAGQEPVVEVPLLPAIVYSRPLSASRENAERR